jgi:hypothetical protein
MLKNKFIDNIELAVNNSHLSETGCSYVDNKLNKRRRLT